MFLFHKRDKKKRLPKEDVNYHKILISIYFEEH